MHACLYVHLIVRLALLHLSSINAEKVSLRTYKKRLVLLVASLLLLLKLSQETRELAVVGYDRTTEMPASCGSMHMC